MSSPLWMDYRRSGRRGHHHRCQPQNHPGLCAGGLCPAPSPCPCCSPCPRAAARRDCSPCPRGGFRPPCPHHGPLGYAPSCSRSAGSIQPQHRRAADCRGQQPKTEQGGQDRPVRDPAPPTSPEPGGCSVWNRGHHGSPQQTAGAGSPGGSQRDWQLGQQPQWLPLG